MRSLVVRRRVRFRSAHALPWLTAVLVTLVVLAVPAGAARQRPNVLVFFTDQEAYPLHLPKLDRPNLERLAAKGVWFTHAYTAYPVCSPNRAALLTGLHPHQNGVMENVDHTKHGPPLEASIPTLGSVLQSAGYHTAYFGKWHLSAAEAVSDYGFDHVGLAVNQSLGLESDEKVAAEAAAWIRSRPRDQPWLAIVSIINPHDIPYPERYADVKIPQYPVSLPASFSDQPDREGAAPELRAYASVARTANLRSKEDWIRYIRLYSYLLEQTDRHLGTVLDSVEERGDTPRSVVVYTTDHGEMGGAHQLRQKRFMYEESVRIPLLVSYPELHHDKAESDVLASTIDIAPTVADLTGVAWPTSLPGRSLRDAAKIDPADFRDAVLVESVFPPGKVPQRAEDMVRMLRTRDWKYVLYPSGAEELYDERADAAEVRNLAASPTHAETREQMRGRLVQAIEETRDRPRRRDGGSTTAAVPLDRLRIEGRRMVDTSGRQVVLRGLVTITAHSNRTPVELGPEDYARMRAWGFNAQAIRLEGCRLGAAPECQLDSAYLDKLDRWTTDAARHGVYTMFKMTTYDVPSWGVGNARNKKRWQRFWDNEQGQQDVLIGGWRHVWQRFVGRPEVVGYDLLNEPRLGENTATLHRDHLFPFYERAATALREIDRDPIVLVQPGVQGALLSERPVRLNDPNVLFVPHYYPRLLEKYEEHMHTILGFAEEAGYAIAFPEYGYPDRVYPFLIGAWTPEIGRLTATILDRHGLSALRPWFVHSPTWGVLEADGSEQIEKMNIVSRPYPQRVAGAATGWSFDFETKTWRVVIEPDAGVEADSEIFVAARRHYPGGFEAEVDGRTFRPDRAAADGLAPADSAREQGLSYDPEAEILSIAPSPRPVRLTLRSSAR
jgi:arylsulfatase A-like enzyme